MAITYPLTIPEPLPDKLVLRAVDVAAISFSPWTGEQQVQQHQGAWWEGEVSLPFMKRAQWAKWAAFLISLRGQVGTFYMPAYMTLSPQGSGGSPKVNGGGQTGATLNLKNFAVSTSNVLLAGDFLQVGDELKQVLTDTSSNGSGYATVDIYPPLRESPANDANVILDNPKGLFRLASNKRQWTLSPGDIFTNISFNIREAF